MPDSHSQTSLCRSLRSSQICYRPISYPTISSSCSLHTHIRRYVSLLARPHHPISPCRALLFLMVCSFSSSRESFFQVFVYPPFGWRFPSWEVLLSRPHPSCLNYRPSSSTCTILITLIQSTYASILASASPLWLEAIQLP